MARFRKDRPYGAFFRLRVCVKCEEEFAVVPMDAKDRLCPDCRPEVGDEEPDVVEFIEREKDP